MKLSEKIHYYKGTFCRGLLMTLLLGILLIPDFIYALSFIFGGIIGTNIV